MKFFAIVLIGVGLSLDAFAVAVANGIIIQRRHLHHALKFGLFFGFFQMAMPVLGWSLGLPFQRIIQQADHWLAFGLLAAIGCKMIYEALKFEKLEESPAEVSWRVLLGLSIATSIDALAVGLSFAFLDIAVVGPALVIGVITFVMSFAGVLLGKRFGHLFEKRIEIIGGATLILIGLKILLDHLWG